MSSDALLLVDAAVFQLRSTVETINDPSLRLATSVLANAVAAAKETLNPARVNDIAFAVNDLVGAMESLSADDAARLDPVVEMLRNDVESLRRATALHPALIEAARAFQGKLRARAAAIQRQTRVESARSEALPHPPEELHVDAGAIRPLLSAAGYETPILDGFCEDPRDLRFHTINEMIDEIDVIMG
jgi:hypothetical protein